MVQCAVFGCNSNNNKKLCRNKTQTIEKIKFFRFPKDTSLQKKWIYKCGRKDKFNVKSSYICWKHFLVEHYARNLQHELLKYSPKNSKKLKPDAVPSQNLPFTEVCNTNRTARQKVRESKRILCEILQFQNYAEEKENVPDEMDNIADNLVPISDIALPVRVDKATSTEDLHKSTNSKEEVQIQNLLRENFLLKNENDNLCKIFTIGQRTKMQRAKRVKWNVDDVSQAIAIYASGPKAYRLLLKKKYPLPAVSTLRYWATKIDIRPGLLNVVFNLMRNADLITSIS